MRSLRGALILGTTVGTAGVFSAAGALLYFLLCADLVTQLDRAICDKARLISSNVEIEGQDIKLDSNWMPDGGNESSEVRDGFQLWRDDTKVVYCSQWLRNLNLQPFGGSFDAPQYRWVTLSQGRTGPRRRSNFSNKRKGNSRRGWRAGRRHHS